MKQILRNTGYTDQVVFYLDGTATDADGAVTVTVTHADGTVEVTDAVTNKTATGTYTYTLGPFTDLTELASAWTGTFSGLSQTLTTHTSIVGGFLFTEAELRAFYKSDLTSETTYPDDDIREARDRITAEFENICGVAFVPTYRRETKPGDGTRLLVVDRPKITAVLAASISGSAQTVSNLTADPLLPHIYHTSSAWTAASTSDPLNVVVSYEHGYGTVPPDIKRAAMILARQQLVKDVTGAGVPETASSWNDGTGQFVSFAANDQSGRWYGIPPVDVALRRYSMQVPIG